ncbi:MAG: FkbM family methyltransferase [Longimicrobiales bacterium]
MPPDLQPWRTLAPNGIERAVIRVTSTSPDRGPRRKLASALRGCMCAWRPAPVDVEVYGFKARLHPRKNRADRRALFYPTRWDATERRLLDALIAPGFQFIDIGANTGLYSLFVAARAGPDAKIIAVEPQPEVKDWLAFNIAANGFTTIHCVDAAIAAGVGLATLTRPRHNRGTASITRPGRRNVQVATLGILDLMNRFDIERADAIKIDIEGAEQPAILAFFDACPETRLPRHIFMETVPHRWTIDSVDLARRAGYTVRARTHMNTVFELSSRRSFSSGLTVE